MRMATGSPVHNAAVVCSKLIPDLPVVLAVDNSRATQDVPVYHDNVREIYEAICLLFGSSNVKILLCNDTVTIACGQHLIHNYSHRIGEGGSKIYTIADGLNQLELTNPFNLVIINKADVYIGDIRVADSIMRQNLLRHGFQIAYMCGVMIGNMCKASDLAPFYRYSPYHIYNIKTSFDPLAHRTSKSISAISIVKTADGAEHEDILGM